MPYGNACQNPALALIEGTHFLFPSCQNIGFLPARGPKTVYGEAQAPRKPWPNLQDAAHARVAARHLWSVLLFGPMPPSKIARLANHFAPFGHPIWFYIKIPHIARSQPTRRVVHTFRLGTDRAYDCRMRSVSRHKSGSRLRHAVARKQRAKPTHPLPAVDLVVDPGLW